jgi:hypothetical protein
MAVLGLRRDQSRLEAFHKGVRALDKCATALHQGLDVGWAARHRTFLPPTLYGGVCLCMPRTEGRRPQWGRWLISAVVITRKKLAWRESEGRNYPIQRRPRKRRAVTNFDFAKLLMREPSPAR